MGYDLYVTRRRDWWAEEGPEIGAEEWLAVVESDPELRLADHGGSCLALWIGHPERDDAWLDWSRGDIKSKHPDPPLIGKMLALAERLGGWVRGDDGEVYTGTGPDDYLPPDTFESPATISAGRSGAAGSDERIPRFVGPELGDLPEPGRAKGVLTALAAGLLSALAVTYARGGFTWWVFLTAGAGGFLLALVLVRLASTGEARGLDEIP